MLVSVNMIEATIMTENEILSTLDNWGRWRYREDSVSSSKMHQLYRMMREWGSNPMMEISTRHDIREEEALLMNRLLKHMQLVNNRELWYEILYGKFVMRHSKVAIAKELHIDRKTVHRKLDLAIGWLCDNSRVFFDIYDLERELIG